VTGEPVLRPAGPQDWASIEALLKGCALPVEGARHHLATFVLAESDAAVIAVAGLEVHGRDGLLRSVAVSPRARGAGVGRRLVDAVEALARARGIERLHLLTTTAPGYFARRGFEARHRSAVPAALRASEEFRGACPDSATYMALQLTPSSRQAKP
jgi:N-acetylglutamate synthase-like GNAT family acetyltransferase